MMKTFILSIALINIVRLGSFAQDTTSQNIVDLPAQIEEMAVKDTIGMNQESDSVEIKIKSKSIIIDDDRVTITDEKKDKYYSYEKRKKKSKEFKGHLEGVDIGMANFMDENYEITRQPDEDFMDLNTGRSHAITIYPQQQSFKFITSRFGLVAAAGFTWANYHFDNNNSIQKSPATGNIEEIVYPESLHKTKLSVGYLNVPVLFELQPFGFGQRAYISAGVLGEIKLFSYTKVVYKSNGDKQKEKDKGDFNMNPLRYGLIARAGYNDFGIYAVYYPVEFFEKGKGPELYPFMVGVSLMLD